MALLCCGAWTAFPGCGGDVTLETTTSSAEYEPLNSDDDAEATAEGFDLAWFPSVQAARLEELIHQLFRLQDLDGNGYLDENELVTLNEAVALMHYGSRADLAKVRATFRELFRKKLNPCGEPVSVWTFREYLLQALAEIDRDPEAQEMALEQFVAEAESARCALATGAGCLLQLPSRRGGAIELGKEMVAVPSPEMTLWT